jgi:hypothetical protein
LERLEIERFDFDLSGAFLERLECLFDVFLEFLFLVYLGGMDVIVF